MGWFSRDLILLHAPSVFDFRESAGFFGPVSDVVPSTPVFEMYPIGLTTIAQRLEDEGFNVRIINIAYRMLKDAAYDVEAEIARLKKHLAASEQKLATTQTALEIMGKAHALLEQISKSADSK